MQSLAYGPETPIPIPQPMFSDKDLAQILLMTADWIRSHAHEIPGFERLGTYYRFRASAIEQWLGALERVLEAEDVAKLLKVPTSWVYTNADQIPGVLRLGRYIRFRPVVIGRFLGGSELAQ